MDMEVILRRIDVRLKRLEGESDASISLKATGSTDTIRNWRRRFAAGLKPGASTRTLQAVADTLGVTVRWLDGDGPENVDDLAEAQQRRARFIEMYDSLDPSLQPLAESQLGAIAKVSPPRRAAARAKTSR